MTGRQSPPWLLASLSAALLLLDWIWFVRPGATYVSVSPEDFLQLADLMHRLATGQTPHVDFHAPMGWLAMWLPYVGFRMQGGFAGALEAADLIMLAALLPLACHALARRAPTWASVAVLIALFGLVAAPWRMGESGWRADPGLHYNHWGWALLTIVLLFGLPGGAKGQWRVAAGAVGVLLSLALFTKVTHFLASLGFVVLFGVVLGEFRRAACWGLALCAACVLVVHAAAGWVDDYVGDLARAVRISLAHDFNAAGGFIPVPLHRAVLEAYSDIAIVLALGAFAAMGGGLRRRTALHCLFGLAACAAALTQDAMRPEYMPAALACIVRIAASETGSGVRKLAAVAVCLHLLPVLPRQALAGVVFSMGVSGGFPDFASRLPRLDGVWFGGASAVVNVFTDDRSQWRGPLDAVLSGRRANHASIDLSHAEFLFTLRSGVRLLRATGAGQSRVMTLDFGNPFPALLNAPPPKGVLFSMFIGRQVDRLTAADPALTLGDADCLMIPKFPVRWESAQLLLAAQGPRLAAEWGGAGENEHWHLRCRKDGRPAESVVTTP